VLTPQEARTLFETVRRMAADGRTVIFISHKLREVEAVADRVTVLRRGRAVATLPATEAAPRELAALMVGRALRLVPVTRRRPASDDAVLEVDDLWAEGDRGEPAVKGVSLSVRRGEIVAVTGVSGNGQRELAESIAGLRRPTAGAVRIRGVGLATGDPRIAITAGLAYVPEDRLGTGLAARMSVASNAALKRYRAAPLSRGPLLRVRKIREFAARLLHRYQVHAADLDTPAWQLSGGNLQKIVLAREFSENPVVLVAASPTTGLDVAGVETVHGYVRDAAADGVGILLISEDLEEVLALADRVAVMYEGAIVGERAAEKATLDDLGLLMAGGGERR
jgi:general nucleoside transport system ATP-binding protein